MVPFVNRTFEWGAVIATFLPILSVVPCHCARLTYFLHTKLRKTDAVLINGVIPLPLRRLQRAGSVSHGMGSGRQVGSRRRCTEASKWSGVQPPLRSSRASLAAFPTATDQVEANRRLKV